MRVTWTELEARGAMGAWLAGDEEARRRLGTPGESPDGAAPPRRLDADLAAALAETTRRAGARDDVVERLRSASRVPTRIVITGQQPGPLGGALMIRHKVAAAAALARRMEARDGVPTVALWWMGADDDDFAEIRAIDAATPELAVISAALGEDAHAVGAMVGGIPAEAVRRLWDAVGRSVATAHGVDARVREALEGARNLADVAAAVVVRSAGGGVGVLDARCPQLRRAGAAVVRAWLENEDAWREIVERSGREMDAVGWGAQVAPAADTCGAFHVRDGRRERVPVVQRARLMEALERDPANVAPGVVLRNLLQDSVLAPAAVVLGPAEIAYRAQVAPLYAEFGIARPAVWPRLFGTWLPAAFLEVDGVEAALAARDVDAFLSRIHDAHRAQSLAEAARAAAERIDEALDGVVDAVSRERGEREARRAARRLDDVRRRARRALGELAGDGRDEARARHPFLRHALSLLRPGGTAQERRLWMLSPEAVDGLGADDWLELAAESLDRTLDGRSAHAVYSGGA